MFKRPSIRYAKTPEAETPYQRAAQVWDERIGSARVQAKSWRYAFFGALGLSAVRPGERQTLLKQPHCFARLTLLHVLATLRFQLFHAVLISQARKDAICRRNSRS